MYVWFQNAKLLFFHNITKQSPLDKSKKNIKNFPFFCFCARLFVTLNKLLPLDKSKKNIKTFLFFAFVLAYS